MSAYDRLLELAADDVRRRNADTSDLICPCHDDHRPSLRLSRADCDALVYCHAGCDTDDVLAAWPGGSLPTAALYGSWWEHRNGHEPIAIYTYTDEHGAPLFEVGRFPGKRFVQRLPGRHGWKGGIGDVRRALYRLPVIDAAPSGTTIYVVEGEKDVHAIERAGGVATCNPGGAGKWRAEYAAYLVGATVIVVQDGDDVGRQHAASVLETLPGARLVEPRVGKDAYDHLTGGFGLDDFVPAGGPPGWLVGTPMDPCAVTPDPLPPLPGFLFMRRAMVAVISGPSGKGRSSLVIACAYDAAREGLRVLYLGGEVTEDEFNARAALMAEKRGHDPEDVRQQLARVRYLDLRTALAHAHKRPAEWIAGAGTHYDVVIIDPLNDALSAVKDRGNRSENVEYVDFYGALIEPLRVYGAAVVMLDNVGHAEDAQERPMGPASKIHKADLIFSCTALDDPARLQIVAQKVRSIRVGFKKGATWECDEATQQMKSLTALPMPSKPAVPKLAQVKAAIRDALPAKTKVAAAAKLGRRDDDPTFRAAWALLEGAGTVAREDGEWKVVVVPTPKGVPPPQLLADEPQNAIYDSEDDRRRR
jgi:AAA domain